MHTYTRGVNPTEQPPRGTPLVMPMPECSNTGPNTTSERMQRSRVELQQPPQDPMSPYDTDSTTATEDEDTSSASAPDRHSDGRKITKNKLCPQSTSETLSMNNDLTPLFDEFIHNSNNITPTANITESRDGIFTKNTNIVHCVPAEGPWNDDLAKELMNRAMLRKETFTINKPETRGIALTKLENKYIITLVMRDKRSDKVNLEDLFHTLSRLKRLINLRKIDAFSFTKTNPGLQDLRWTIVKKLFYYIFGKTNVRIMLCTNETMIPDVSLREGIIKEYHESLLGGHQGVTKIYNRIRENYHWPNIKAQIQDFVKTCDSCQKKKLVRIKTKLPMIITDTPADTFDKVALDIIGPLPVTESNNQYLLTVQCNLTKFLDAIPLPNATAQTIERSHLVLIEHIEHYIKTGKDWDKYIRFAIFCYNTAKHEGTGFTPYQLIFGKEAQLLSNFKGTAATSNTYDTFMLDLLANLTDVRKRAIQNLQYAKQRSKSYYDKKINTQLFEAGQKVFLINESRSKLDDHYKGPCVAVLTNYAHTSFTTTTLSTNPGIYYEQLPDLRTFDSEWTLISYVNVENLTSKLGKLERYHDILYNGCKMLGSTCGAKDVLTLSKKRLLTLTEYLQQIGDLVGYKETNEIHVKLSQLAHARVERNWYYSLVGTIHKTLYGTLNEEDGEYYNSQIDRLFNDTNHLALLLANQTHIVQSTLGAHERKIDNIEKHTSELDGQTIFLFNTSHTLKTRLEQNSAILSFAEHVITLEEMTNEYELDLNYLVDAISFAQNGIIHPRILTPKQLITSLQHIQSLEPLLRFPVPLRNIYAVELIKLCQLEIAYNEPNLIYVLSIPLLNDETFNLFHLIPIPAKQNFDKSNNKFAHITPSNDYIAVASNRNSYFHLSETDFSQCKKSSNSYIYKQNHPLYHTNNHGSCEIELFLNNPPKTLETCDIRIDSFDGSFWSKLRAPNTWLYSVSKPETMHISCPDVEATRTTLTGSGILRLDNKCSGYSEAITLIASNDRTSTTFKYYVPEFALNLTEIYQNLNANHTVNLSSIPMFHKYKPTVNIDDLNSNGLALSDIIKQATEISTHHRDKQETTSLKTALTYAGVAISAIGILYLIYRFSAFSKILTIFKLCSCNGKKRHTRSKHATYDKPISLEIIRPHLDAISYNTTRDTRLKALPPPLPTVEPKPVPPKAQPPTFITVRKHPLEVREITADY
ncbi:uncharacterized protein LOC125502163 [Athalia rosae]|uniref:uncharacterized protein LOC125502163 n=1 Tax=Athalia rosae TaxID=37344 RepID=UPI00203445E2|nr:uncharacterized protein LOC125502163 [Athalia rosae]